MKPVFGAALFGMLFGGAAHAATVTILTDPAGAANTGALTAFATTGADMAGMQVTASFDDGFTEMATWTTTGVESGQAAGTDWSVSVTGDTFFAVWDVLHFRVGSLVRLLFEGAPGDTVFDMISSPALSPGSELGRPYTDSGPLTGDITVTYSRPLSVAGTFYGDLYLNMDVDYQALDRGGIPAQTTLMFLADTDNVLIPGDITPAIPVPAAGLLLISALGGLGLFARRRRRA